MSNIAGIRFAHVRMQEATRVNLQPYHGADATVGVDSANNRLVVNAPFDGVGRLGHRLRGSLANGQIENVLANRILRQGQDVLKVGVTYYVVNLDRSVNGQVSFQLRDGQGNLVNFSGATTGGAMQRFSVDNPAGALLNANGSLTLPKAHGRRRATRWWSTWAPRAC